MAGNPARLMPSSSRTVSSRWKLVLNEEIMASTEVTNRETFAIDERSEEYPLVKRNRNAMYECPKCKDAMELEAKLAFGRALLRDSKFL